MFFLLRIGFWLTVVFLLLPAVASGPSTHVSSTGEPKVSAMDAVSAATSAMADASGFCARQPQACAIGAGLIQMIGERAEAGARFALSYLSEQIVEEKRKAAERAGASRAGDTLTTHDLSPAWQGPKPPEAIQPAELTGSAAPAPAVVPPAAVSPAVPLPPKRPA